MTTARLQPAISTTSTVVVSKDQVSSDLAGEAVILHLRSGRYYGLANVGARIWYLMSEPRRIAEIRDVIMHEYDVGRDRCEQDVVSLLEQLAAEGLVEVLPGTDP